MPPEPSRRLVAKKSAPSHYGAPYSFRPTNEPPRSVTSTSLEDRIKYIDKWGERSTEACLQCKQGGIGNTCFVAIRASSLCGNCLRIGADCQFAENATSMREEDEEVETSQEEMVEEEVIIDDEPVSIKPTLHSALSVDTQLPTFPTNLRNYDPEDSDYNSISNDLRARRKKDSSPDIIAIESSPLRSPTTPKTRRKHSKTVSPQKSITPQVQSYPPQATVRDVTPPLAMGDHLEPIYASHMTSQGPSRLSMGKEESDLSISEKRLVMMAIQETIDWNLVAMESGVDIDKIRKWWLKASTELVRRG